MKKSMLSCNLLIEHKQRQRKWEKHQKRLKDVHSTFTTAPTSQAYIKKQPFSQFNKIFTINLQNKALLKKLTRRTVHKVSWEKPYKMMKNNRREYFENYKKKRENQGMMKRLKQCKSSYETGKYAQERRKTQRYINSICKFQYKDFKPNKTILKENCYTIHLPPNSPQVKQIKTQKNVSNHPKEKALEIIPSTTMKIDSHHYQVRGVIWEHRISLELQKEKDEDIYQLEASLNIFKQKYQSRIENLLKEFLPKIYL